MISESIKSTPYAAPLRSGRGGRRFESYHSDQLFQAVEDQNTAKIQNGAQDGAQDSPKTGLESAP